MFDSQISNRNFLLANGFKFVLQKYPKVDFFCSEANIPSINLGIAVQSSYLKDIPIPGDKLTYEDLTLRFNVDEDLTNYLIVHKWLRGFGYPSNLNEYQQLLDEDQLNPGKQNANSGQSDGDLIIYNSNFKENAIVRFTGLFPVSLSTIRFDAKITNTEYITAEVVFKYTLYDIIKL
jgi:hypothetical protein